jgi:hypothetical protein
MAIDQKDNRIQQPPAALLKYIEKQGILPIGHIVSAVHFSI